MDFKRKSLVSFRFLREPLTNSFSLYMPKNGVISFLAEKRKNENKSREIIIQRENNKSVSSFDFHNLKQEDGNTRIILLSFHQLLTNTHKQFRLQVVKGRCYRWWETELIKERLNFFFSHCCREFEPFALYFSY